MTRRRAAVALATALVAAGTTTGLLVGGGSSGGRALVSYNQGLAIADYALLYKDTGNYAYLKRAQALALASGRQFGNFGWGADVGQNPGFSAAYFRGLAYLQALAPDPYWVHQRALFAAFIHRHHVKGRVTHEWSTGLWHDPAYPTYRYAFLWQTSQAVAAGLGRGSPRALRALHWYWEPRSSAFGSALRNANHTPFGDLYYDDNAWAALDYLKAYGLTHARGDLRRAEQTFRFLAGGWDRRFGGELWARVSWNHDLSTVATAATAEVALHLYARTGRRGYLAWGQRAMAWLEKHMRARNGLLYDRLSVVVDRHGHGAVVNPHGGAYGPHVRIPPDPVLYDSALAEVG